MKIDLFVLPEVMRRDFIEAFVLDREDFTIAHPDWAARWEKTRLGLDGWYRQAFLWEKLSPDIKTVDFATALSLLRQREGRVLFMSESEQSGHDGGMILHGRVVYDYVAMVDGRELADLVEYEWDHGGLLFHEGKLTLPEDLYVFDTSLQWVIIFTHEWGSRGKEPPARCCKVFGL